MQEIIDPIDPRILIDELELATFVCETNKANNHIYVTDAHRTPQIMREIARLRELSFRQGGGGSGRSLDIDDKDTMPNAYKQLIVWSPDTKEIVGGYRYIKGCDVKFDNSGQPIMAMEHIFTFSKTFIEDYLPYTLELGRAFVQPKYQSIKGGLKALYALDNLWDGIGAVVAENPSLKYLIGKVTIYSHTPVIVRSSIVHYMNHYFAKKTGLLEPKKPEIVDREYVELFEREMRKDDYKKDFKWLNNFVKQYNSSIPPLFHAYIDLSDTLSSFGTVFDPDFGDIYDTGIMLTLEDVYEVKRERYIASYLKKVGNELKRNFV